MYVQCARDWKHRVAPRQACQSGRERGEHLDRCRNSSSVLLCCLRAEVANDGCPMVYDRVHVRICDEDYLNLWLAKLLHCSHSRHM